MNDEIGFSEVTERVSTALEEDPRTADYAIEVIDNHGLVTIKGLVPSEDVAEVAEDITRRQEGVISVTNALVVAQDDDDIDLLPSSEDIDLEENERLDADEADEGLDEDQDRDVLIVPPAIGTTNATEPPTGPI